MPGVMRAAIGDIHGCREEMEELIELIRVRFDGREGEIVLLGDYIDRGPDSKGVMDVIRYWDDPLIKLIALKGNHDEMMIRALLDGDAAMERVWLSRDSGGMASKFSFGLDLLDYAGWMRENLLVSYRTPRHFFVHAGIRPGFPFEQQEERDMLWIRNPFLNYLGDHEDGLIVVHGHTPCESDCVEVMNNRLGLDTGCVFGGTLSAAIFDPDENLIGIERVEYKW